MKKGEREKYDNSKTWQQKVKQKGSNERWRETFYLYDSLWHKKGRPTAEKGGIDVE